MNKCHEWTSHSNDLWNKRKSFYQNMWANTRLIRFYANAGHNRDLMSFTKITLPWGLVTYNCLLSGSMIYHDDHDDNDEDEHHHND